MLGTTELIASDCGYESGREGFTAFYKYIVRFAIGKQSLSVRPLLRMIVAKKWLLSDPEEKSAVRVVVCCQLLESAETSEKCSA